MRSLRYIPLFAATVAGIVLLAGAGRHSNGADAPSCVFSPVPPAVADRSASQTLEAAAAALAPNRVSWLDAAVRLRVQLPELEYEATGRFCSGPEHRYRLELRTHVGDKTATLLSVSDGATLWHAHRIESGDWNDVRRVRLHQVFDGLKAAPQQRDEFTLGPSFSGPLPLLRNLSRHLVWVDRREFQQNGTALIELTGVWPGETVKETGPDGVPDRCRLVLDAESLWPRRIEWWGPAESGARLVRLVQIELRDPVANRALSVAECVRTYSFQPGTATIVDETPLTTAPQ